MSASTIARCNAIPMTQQADDAQHIMKRTRSEDDGSDDDISIVSRSPSPNPDHMDVDTASYSGHSEVITVETRIKPENKGFALLAKMGWSEGQPLGLSGDGRIDPIPFQLKNDITGIGKITRDIRMIETTVSQRRGLDSERQQKETEDQRKAREDLVARKATLVNEITSTLRPFYCELCDKQFKNVAQYDEHTNSYAHHHKARLRDMHVNARPTPKDELDKRKEKERRREEKELRKIAAANGIKMPKPPVQPGQASTSAVPPFSSSVSSSDSKMDTQLQPAEPKKAGWAKVSAPAAQPGFKQSSWSTAVVSPSPQPQPSSNSWAPASTGAQPPPTAAVSHTSSAPAFHNAGWTLLDTGSSQKMPSTRPNPPVLAAPLPPPPESQATPAPGAGWKQFQSAMKSKNRR